MTTILFMRESHGNKIVMNTKKGFKRAILQFVLGLLPVDIVSKILPPVDNTD